MTHSSWSHMRSALGMDGAAAAPDEPLTRRDYTLLYQAVCDFVGAHISCSYAELYAQFGEQPSTDLSQKRMRHILMRLTDTCNLITKGTTQARRWQLHPLYRGKVRPAREKPQDSMPGRANRGNDGDCDQGAVCSPRTYDVMNAPLYRSEPVYAARPGALDFQAIASVGVRC